MLWSITNTYGGITFIYRSHFHSWYLIMITSWLQVASFHQRTTQDSGETDSSRPGVKSNLFNPLYFTLGRLKVSARGEMIFLSVIRWHRGNSSRIKWNNLITRWCTLVYWIRRWSDWFRIDWCEPAPDTFGTPQSCRGTLSSGVARQPNGDTRCNR